MSKDQKFKDFQLAGQMMMKPGFQFDRLSTYDKEVRGGLSEKTSRKSKGTQDKSQSTDPYAAPQLPEQNPMASSGDAMDVPQVEKPKSAVSKVLDKTRNALDLAKKGVKSDKKASSEAKARSEKNAERPVNAKKGTGPQDSAGAEKHSDSQDSAKVRKDAGAQDSANGKKNSEDSAKNSSGEQADKTAIGDTKSDKASDGKDAEKTVKPVADKSDSKAGKGAKTARKDGAKNSRSAGKGKAASGRRGGIAGGSFGANAPTVSPKGPGTGANAIQAYAGSGVSYQVEHYGALGKEMAGDLGDSRDSLNDQLPGEKKVQGNGKGNQALQNSAQSTKTDNQAGGKAEVKAPVKNVLDDAMKSAKKLLEAQKKRANRNRSEELPEKPTVDMDNSSIDAARAEEAECVMNAQSSAEDVAAGLDRTLPTRGFDDIQVAKPEITVDVNGIETADIAGMEEVAQLEDEAKGLLDISEIADPTSQKMAEASKSVDEAEATSKQETEAKIAEHNAAVDKAKLEAEQSEKNLIASKRMELDNRVNSETEKYNQQLSSYDEAKQKEITAAQNELDAERAKAQATIDKEHAKAEAEKKRAERESNDDRSLLEKGIDWVKSQAKKLKDKICKIIDDVKKAICDALDKLAEIAAKIDKDLGAKIKAITDELKVQVEAYAESLKEAVCEYIDEVVDSLVELAEELSALYDTLVQAFNDAMNAIVGALKAAYEAAAALVQSALDFLGEVFVYILRKACEFVGMNPDIVIDAAAKIVQHPIDFLSTLWTGIKEGGHNFIKNFASNALVMLRNLFALWLEPSGITIPENIPSLASFIELGFSIIGIDLHGILTKIESAGQPKKEESDEDAAFSDDSDLDNLLTAIKTGGISVLIGHIMPSLGGIDTEIIQEIIVDLVPKLITKGLEKLVMMANPATGIISAIKGAWDLVQFFIERFEAIKGLATSIMNVLVKCANGDSSAAAAAMEAGLCQFLPIAADLLIRLFGFNVGGEIKKIVKRIGGKIRSVVDKFIGKFNKKTGAHIKTSKEREKAQKERKQNYEDAKRVRAQNVDQGKASLSDRMGNWGDKASSRVSHKKQKKEERVFDATGMSNMFEGKKVGNLGINLNNSKYVKAIDSHYELKHAHDRLDEAGGDSSKLSRADQKLLWDEQVAKSDPNYKDQNLWEKLKDVHAQKTAEDDYKKKKKESKKAKTDEAKKVADDAKKADGKSGTKEPKSKKPTQQMLDNTFDNIDASRLGNTSSNFGKFMDAEARFNGVSAADRMADAEAARYEAYWKSKEPEIAANEQRKAEEASHVITATPEELEAHKKRGEDVIAASAARGRALREKYKDVDIDVDANIQKRVEIAEERKKAEAAGWVKEDGSIWWPDNKRGFDALPGSVRPKTLQPGEILSRYSNKKYNKKKNLSEDRGSYFAKDGESKTARAMAPLGPNEKEQPEYRFVVIRPITVTASNATPWFGEKGMGVQYNSGDYQVYDKKTKKMEKATVEVLLRNNYIKIL